jgi:PPOX class probable FMN-dependent enzyme
VKFAEVIRGEEDLRAVVGNPAPRAVSKALLRLDEHCRAIISRSPFVVISSSDALGRMDASPKGDPAGFVHVLDDVTLAIPDRPGNRRFDTFTNLLQNPRVGILFIVPGRQETLRVNGQGIIVRDAWLRERMAMAGKVPRLALVITVEEAFVHCGKCMIRSRLWEPQSWSPLAPLPSHARCLLDQAKPDATLAEIEDSVQENYKSGLY